MQLIASTIEETDVVDDCQLVDLHRVTVSPVGGSCIMHPHGRGSEGQLLTGPVPSVTKAGVMHAFYNGHIVLCGHTSMHAIWLCGGHNDCGP